MNKIPFTAVLLSAALSGRLGAVDLQPLLDNSPFGRAAKADAAGGDAPAAPLEFRGLVVEGDINYFSVFDPSSQRGYWISEGQGDQEIAVSKYDPDALELVVTQAGRTLRLPMKTASIVAGAMPAPAVTPVAAANPGEPGRPPQPNARARTTNQAADARRLEAVAAEVRRRRSLRQATANGTPAAQQPAPVQPAPATQ